MVNFRTDLMNSVSNSRYWLENGALVSPTTISPALMVGTVRQLKNSYARLFEIANDAVRGTTVKSDFGSQHALSFQSEELELNNFSLNLHPERLDSIPLNPGSSRVLSNRHNDVQPANNAAHLLAFDHVPAEQNDPFRRTSDLMVSKHTLPARVKSALKGARQWTQQMEASFATGNDNAINVSFSPRQLRPISGPSPSPRRGGARRRATADGATPWRVTWDPMLEVFPRSPEPGNLNRKEPVLFFPPSLVRALLNRIASLYLPSSAPEPGLTRRGAPRRAPARAARGGRPGAGEHGGLAMEQRRCWRRRRRRRNEAE